MLTSVLTLALVSASYAQETVLGVYMFHRHGDRTPKALPPANLTDLGYAQVYNSGNYYRNRYINADATAHTNIMGISSNVVKQSQISVSAPQDVVLMNSAQGFLQALYPPVGSNVATQQLRNGSDVTAPMDGYQLIPISTVSTGAGSENSAWLQDASDCGKAEASSNAYYYSPEYMDLLNSTADFYQSVVPVVNNTFNSSYTTYKNAYSVFDLINVATIHNQSIQSDSILSNDDTFRRLGNLANIHEFNLAYNSSSEIRAIAGMQLAGQALHFLNNTITKSGSGAPKLGIQFGAYATFQSYFGLADLTAADELFYGIPDYASSMVWELYTSADTSGGGIPAIEDLRVRFFFHNGTANASSPLVQYPLFGRDSMSLGWRDFADGMERFAVGDAEQWCMACGNTTGACAQYAGEVNAADGTTSSGLANGGGDGISKAVAGVIGAMVTLGVVLLVEGAIMLFGGLTIVRRKRLVAGKAVANGEN